MRGKGVIFEIIVVVLRITPAYAGKRICQKILKPQQKDHPRLCGEKLYLKSMILSMQGSPPPMRGKVILFILRFPNFRITPAYAGKRWSSQLQSFFSQDHPRLCGEKYLQK